MWADKIATMNDAEWTQHTSAAYMVDGNVVGFPVAVEGYGLAYNADILAKAGIDPAKSGVYELFICLFCSAINKNCRPQPLQSCN